MKDHSLSQQLDAAQATISSLKKRLKKLESEPLSSPLQKQLMYRQRWTENHLQKMIPFPDLNPNPVMTCHVDGWVDYSNAASKEILKFLTWTGQHYTVPNDWIMMANKAVACLRHVEFDIELDGAFYEVSVVAHEASDRVIFYLHNMTQLKISESRFLDLQYMMKEIYCRVSIDGIILDLSPSVSEVTHYSRDELLGTNAALLYPNPHERKDYIQALTKDGKVENFPIKLKDKDGTYFQFYITAILVYQHGQPCYIDAILSDQTERFRLQEELEKQCHEAVLANQAKSIFLATMSHELRTPLHGIIGLQNFLIKEATYLRPAHQEHLNLAQHSSHVLMSLINDILDLSKIEANKITVKLSHCCLPKLLKNALVPFMMRAKEKNISLSLHFENIPTHINVDETHIRQVLLNLIGNAVKFTSTGFIKVKASYHGGMLHIAIEDSGIGIKADALESIFAPFSQLNREGSYQGTGLGITIAHRFMTLMQGQLHVSSVFGEGSTFVISLPIEVMVDEYFTQYVDLTEHLNPSKAIQPTIAQPLHVLLAEDDDISRIIATKTLTDAGFTVDSAKHGLEAWEKTLKNRYDLLLTDIRMPGLTGIRLTQKIREAESDDQVPMYIIGLSADALETVAEECLQIGMNAFIPKPIDPDQLLQQLAKHTKAEI